VSVERHRRSPFVATDTSSQFDETCSGVIHGNARGETIVVIACRMITRSSVAITGLWPALAFRCFVVSSIFAREGEVGSTDL
jgi:hypothetical protein